MNDHLPVGVLIGWGWRLFAEIDALYTWLSEEKAIYLSVLRIVGLPLAFIVLLDIISRKEGDGSLYLGPYLLVILAPLVMAVVMVPFVEEALRR